MDYHHFHHFYSPLFMIFRWIEFYFLILICNGTNIGEKNYIWYAWRHSSQPNTTKLPPRLIELENVLITNPKFEAKEKMLSFLKTHLFRFFVDNPSSKSAIETSFCQTHHHQEPSKTQNKIVALPPSCLQLHKHTPQIFLKLLTWDR
jgi:hypothetical protein